MLADWPIACGWSGRRLLLSLMFVDLCFAKTNAVSGERCVDGAATKADRSLPFRSHVGMRTVCERADHPCRNPTNLLFLNTIATRDRRDIAVDCTAGMLACAARL